jgi:hypothetical protein
MSASSDVEVFILVVCEEIEKNTKKKEKRKWMNDTFLSRFKEGGFHTQFQELRKDPVRHRQDFRQEYCFSHQVKLPSVFASPM